MSASQQKKSRQDKKAAYMTERQRQEAQEAKKLKIYTTTFWIVLALCVSIVLGTVLSNPVKNVIFKNSTAVNVGSYTLNAVQVNYYYIDTVNNYYNQYGSYASIMGLDFSKPLNKQVYDNETGKTWADAFVESAMNSIKSTYALYELAMKEDFKLTEDEQKSIDSTFSTLSIYAMYYGYKDVDAYLTGIYGNGADEESFREYTTINQIADSYYTKYADSLDYSNEDIRNYEAANNNEKYNDFTSLTYATYYLAYSKWTPSKDADGNALSYTDAQKDEARAEAKKAAEALAAGTYADLDAFDKAIAALEINKDQKTGITCSRNEDQLFTSVNELFRDWLINKDRKDGDMTVIEYATGEGDSKVINGYYVVRFGSVNENKFALKDVRHILVSFEGGKYNSTTGQTTYTDAEKKAALEKAEALLNEWKNGEATADSFGALADEKTTDSGSKGKGGLYEEVYPGQMVENFENWAYDETRKAGDTGIVESPYGYHIMYFVGDSDIDYRDFMIRNTLQSEELEKWMEKLIEELSFTLVSDKHIEKDLVFAAQ